MKKEVAVTFSRAAETYAELAHIQYQGAEILLSLLKQAGSIQTQRLLDLGCGPGVHTETLQSLTAKYLGLDISPGMLAKAKEKHKKTWFICADMEHMPFADNSFDIIFSNFSVQWATTPRSVVCELSRVLKPGGCAYFSTVLENSLMPFLALRSNYLVGTCSERLTLHERERHAGLDQWKQALDDSHFMTEIAQVQRLQARFPTVKALIRSVSKIGAHAKHPGQKPEYGFPPLTRAEFTQICSAYETFREPDGLPLYYQIGIFKIIKNSD